MRQSRIASMRIRSKIVISFAAVRGAAAGFAGISGAYPLLRASRGELTGEALARSLPPAVIVSGAAFLFIVGMGIFLGQSVSEWAMRFRREADALAAGERDPDASPRR